MPSNLSYLKRLPRAAQKRGNSRRGEAEIVTAPREAQKIEAKCAKDLSGSALGKGGKRIGILLEDEVRMVVRDPVRYPSGATKCQMRVIGKTQFDGPDGVAVLPMLNGECVLREIYRHATRSWELEITRGRREPGQTSRQAARKEIKEELGYSVKKLHFLGRIRPDSAILASELELFLAELKPGPREDEPEPTEALGDVVRLTPEQLGKRILRGRIRDSYTMAALLLAQLKGLVPADAG